ncbi:Pycsar system effector family protein [Microbispora sp. CA-135349]|uniref:Pycsar system effector family protein n=1 Tax=Microbispora sp. CA-135349 TaxID=3239953 RepID=UPI003D8D667D
MTTLPPPVEPAPADTVTLADLYAEASLVRAELARVDGKAGLLLSWAGAALAVVTAATTAATSTTRVPAAALAGLWAAAGLLGVAVAVLLLAVRPRIPRTGGTGFVVHARAASPAALLHTLTAADAAGHLAADVWLLSRLAVTKYRRLRLAVDFLIVALLVLAAALTFA